MSAPQPRPRQVPLFPSLWPLYTAADCRGFCLLPPGTSRLAVLPPPCGPCTLLMLAVKSAAARGLSACMFLSSRCLAARFFGPDLSCGPGIPQSLRAVHNHWRELPQASFFTTNTCLSRQNYALPRQNFCRDKIFLSQQNVCRYKYLSRQTRNFCRDKHTFVATKNLFCLVSTKVCLSRQMFCRDKNDTCGRSRQ